jgi:diguanylate cyclase (GGDEF)-like protein
MTPTKSSLHTLDLFARTGSAVVVAMGASVMLGWLFDIRILKSVVPGFEPMRVNTACAFIAAGAALWLMNASAPKSPSRRLARFLAGLVTAIGVLTLAEDFLSINLGIDQLIFSAPAQSALDLHPGRMALITAFDLTLIGMALLALKSDRPRFSSYAQWLAIFPLLLSTVAIVGYAYGVNSFYHVKPYAPMAVHTAWSFFLLSLSVLAANPAHSVVSIFASDSAGGVVCRRLLPTIPLALFVLGWLRLEGQRAGLYGTEFGLAFMVVLSIAICVLAVVSTALTLRKVDLKRQRAEAEILALNTELERRVRERTQQLAYASTELRVANKSLEQLSLEDALTNLANRRLFDTYLTAQMAIARRHKRSLALVLCDIDSFKAFNDQYGHPAGDICLKEVATTLRACCRRPGDMAARYGGEEFALILPDTDLAGATRIAETARNAVAQLSRPHPNSQTASYVSISGGVAVLTHGADTTPDQLIATADERLFEAKRQGRNRIVWSQDAAPIAPAKVSAR